MGPEPLRARQKTSSQNRRAPQPRSPQPYLAPSLRTQFLRSLGNKAVGGLLQTKLKIGQSNDKFEREADRISDLVMGMPLSAPVGIAEVPSKIQRKCGPCANGQGLCPRCAEGAETVQLKTLGSRTTLSSAPLTIHLSRFADSGRFDPMGWIPASSGRPLPQSVRHLMESRFQVDFSGVRIHADAEAGQATFALGARAFTTGQEVYFAPGHFQPHTRRGMGLLAHELTHVVQQRNGRVSSGSSTVVAAPRSSLEDEAEATEGAFQQGGTALHVAQTTTRPVCQRQITEGLGAIRMSAAGGIEAEADRVASLVSRTDPFIAKLYELLGYLRSYDGPLILPPPVIAQLNNTYGSLRARTPSWLPVPEIGLRHAEIALPRAVPIFSVVLLLAFFIIMLWYLGNFDPATRKVREREVEELIKKIEKAIKKPKSEPKRPPLPPGQRPRPRTRPKARECSIYPAYPRGGNTEHSELARFVTGDPNEYLVVPPEGPPKQYDGMDAIGTLYEVKTKYDFLQVLGLPESELSNRGAVKVAWGVSRLRWETRREVDIANACGRDFRMATNNLLVVEHMRDILGDIIHRKKIEWVDFSLK